MEGGEEKENKRIFEEEVGSEVGSGGGVWAWGKERVEWVIEACFALVEAERPSWVCGDEDFSLFDDVAELICEIFSCFGEENKEKISMLLERYEKLGFARVDERETIIRRLGTDSLEMKEVLRRIFERVRKATHI